MPFRIPRESEGVHPLQAKVYPQDLSILASAQSGNGVLSGCQVTAIGGSQVNVSAGVIVINGVRTVINAQNVGVPLGTIMTRFDLIVAYSDGTVSDLWGQEAEAPQPRDVPTNGVVLASIYVVAMDRAIEGYQIVDKRVFIRLNSGGVYNVLDYGAVGDGVTDDTVAIQNAITDAIVTSGGQFVRGGPVIFPRGRYRITSPVVIPLFVGGTYGTPFLISGYGAQILSIGSISTFKRELPTSTAQAGNAATIAPIIEGFGFLGPNLTGSRAIEMIATYGFVVRDCVIKDYDIGISAAFCLKARFENIFVQNCSTYGFSVTSGSGQWADANLSNSQSNSTEFNSCRVSAKTGQTAAYFLRDSDNFRLLECIVEGENPVNNVDYSSGGRHTLLIENMHFENTPTGAHIRAVVRGRAVIRNPVFYATNTTLIDGSGSNDNATILVDGLTWIDTNNKFKHGATETYAWDFRGISDNENLDTSGSTRWVGGIVPTRLRTLLQGAAIGVNDQTIRKRARGANSVADGGTISHGLGATPVVGRVQASLAGQFASVTALGVNLITVALKQHDGTSGSTQTVYWEAET